MIDVAHFCFVSGLLVSLVFGVVLVVRLYWEAGFKDVDRFFTKEYVNSEHKILKRIIIFGNTLVFTGVLIFITGKVLGYY